MPPDPEGSPPPENTQLPPDRCPNCGGPLRFPEDDPLGLCTACGIYVEILTRLLPVVAREAATPPPGIDPRGGDISEKAEGGEGPVPYSPSSNAEDVAKRREAA